jgi:hypothetical protein
MNNNKSKNMLFQLKIHYIKFYFIKKFYSIYTIKTLKTLKTLSYKYKSY